VLPLPDTEPPLACHVTEVFEVLLTVAVRLTVPPVYTLAVGGVTLTVTGGGGGGGGVLTSTVAVANALPSAVVAVTVSGPAVPGAV
jgi:hypothetical protein